MSPTILTDANFAAEIESHQGVALVDFWAPWCGPCRMVAPVVEELAGELDGRVKVAKLDVDVSPATAKRYSIRAIPTLLVFRGGRVVDSIVGMASKRQLVQRLEALVAHPVSA